MEKFVKGDIVVVPFPFSDRYHAKRRPALVLADLSGNDIILSQITSQNNHVKYAILLKISDFETGNLEKESRIRPNRIFAADKNIILRKIGHIDKNKYNEVAEKLIQLIK